MWKVSEKIKFYKISFYIFISVYAIWICSFTNFSIIDDHTLTQTLLINKKISFFIHENIGRFYPLDAMDLNILSSIFGVNSFVFYLFSAMAMIVVVLCMRYVVKQILNIESKWIYIALFLFLLTPGFATAYGRLFVPEKYEIFFLAIFMFSYIYFIQTQKLWPIISGLVALNIALYYKEPAFFMAGVFGLSHFIFSFKYATLKNKIFDIAICISGAIWVVVYYIVVLSNKVGDARYGESPYDAMIVIAKTIFNYAVNEPFIIILGGGLLLYRIYMIFMRKAKFEALFDSMLLAGLGYISIYFVLKMYGPHYPLPAYIFLLGAFCGYLFKLEYIKIRFIKILAILSLLLFFSNSIFFWTYSMAHYKFIPKNFQDTISFLSEYSHQNNGVNIYLEGVSRASGVEVFMSFGRWLEYNKAKNIDLLSDIGMDNVLLWDPNPSNKYSVFQNDALIEKKSGDIVVITPFISYDYRTIDTSKWELLHVSDFGWNVPNLGIKTLLKYIIRTLGPDDKELIMTSSYGLPLYFYVYRVR